MAPSCLRQFRLRVGAEPLGELPPRAGLGPTSGGQAQPHLDVVKELGSGSDFPAA